MDEKQHTDVEPVPTYFTFEREDVVSLRVLSDGRILGVFVRAPEPSLKRVTVEVVVEGVCMAVPRLQRCVDGEPRWYVSINDDRESEWWRTLTSCNTEGAASAYYNNFQEGQDDRRTTPERRISGIRPNLHNPDRRQRGRRAGDLLLSLQSDQLQS